jgi:phage baseplate assembly protein W
MATNLGDIIATNWQLSGKTIGQVVSGIEDIRQCVGIILTTTKGSCPLNPLFGSDIWRFIDTPVSTAVANISAEILDSVGKWEPRITIRRLTYEIVGSMIIFNLTISLLESSEITEVLRFFIDAQSQIGPPSIGRAFTNGFDFGFN